MKKVKYFSIITIMLVLIFLVAYGITNNTEQEKDKPHINSREGTVIETPNDDQIINATEKND